MDIRYAEIIKWFRYNHPEHMDRLFDSLSPNQIACKNWLVENLDNVQIPRDENGKFRIEIIGGWYGFPLIQLLMEKYKDEIREIDLFELDEFACLVVWRYCELFGYNNVRIFHKNYFDYKEIRRTHMIINTSCEHMHDMILMQDFYQEPNRTLLVLQSNNKTDEPDHINCVDNCQQLIEQNDLNEIWGGNKTMRTIVNGEKQFWNRFMVMGKW